MTKILNTAYRALLYGLSLINLSSFFFLPTPSPVTLAFFPGFLPPQGFYIYFVPQYRILFFLSTWTCLTPTQSSDLKGKIISFTFPN